MKHSNQKIPKNRGQVMMISMLFLVMLSLLVVFGLAGPVVRDYRIASESLLEKQSYFLAESSIEDFYYRIKNNIAIANSETLYDGSNYNTITVTDLGGGQKQIESQSNVSGRARAVSSIIQTANATTTHLNYAVQSGLGGFVLSNNARIVGSVYSSGNIVGSNGATITGSTYVASSIPLAADQTNDQPTIPTTGLTFGNTSANQDTAQSFQISTTEKLNKVRFYIKKVGSPNGNITARITGDNAGKPSTTTVASTTVTPSLISTSYTWVEADFTSSGAILDAGATYWLVFDTASQSTSKYFTIATNTNGYANGNASLGTYGGTSWTAQSSDLYFSIWIGGFNGQIQNVSVGGSANAYTVSGSTVTGTLYCKTGSSNNKSCNTTLATPSPLPLPYSTTQIDAWKAEAEAGGVTDSSLTISSNQNLGPRKINGNLLIDNGLTVTITGAIWVTGNITISNNSLVKLASSYNSNSGVIIADGVINLLNNSGFQGSGATGSYVLAISTNNGTGFDLSNNAGAVIVYVPYGKILVSNNAGASQLTAETVELSNNATITYDTTLANAPVLVGGNQTATSIVSWKETQ